MHWRKQGDLGELFAMEWFASKGAIVALGGPRYAEFEVEPGPPLPGDTEEESASTIAS